MSPRIRALVVAVVLLSFLCAAGGAVGATRTGGEAHDHHLGKAGTTYVYITDTGTKYHRNGCTSLRKSKHRVTLKWAKKNGYGACKICRPPK